MRKIRWLVLIFTWVIQACSDPASPILRIGTNVWPGYEPLYVAADQGVFGDRVEMVEYRAAGQVLSGMRKGNINMAAVTLDEAVRIAASGQHIEVIWIFNISNGADQLLSRADITTITDLKGKRIGVESNALGAYLLQRFFAIHQLNASDYQIIGMDLTSHAQAMQTNVVDAVLTFEPEASKIQKQGAHVLFSSKEVPGEVIDVLIVRRDGENPPNTAQISQFIQQYATFFHNMQQHWSAYYQPLNQRMKLPPEDLEKAYQQMWVPSIAEQKKLLQDQAHLQQVLAGYEQVLLAQKIIRQPCPCQHLVNSNYVVALP